MPGVIFVRDSPTAEEEKISLIKQNVDLNYLLTSMPNIFNSGGLSEERKLYSVMQTSRPFCSDKFKDLTCPSVN